jgi:predicted peptidase
LLYGARLRPHWLLLFLLACDGSIGLMSPAVPPAPPPPASTRAPAPDAGRPPEDGGVLSMDAGQPVIDAGSVSDGGAPLIQAPLTGNVTQGNWQYGDLPFEGIATGQFHYAYLLPDGYGPQHRYPILVYEHENTEGNSWYQYGGDPTQNTIVYQDVIDGVFNSVEFRTRYPAIVIVPFCDQTDGSAGSSGQNFGGYNDSPGNNVNENAVVAVVKRFLTDFSAFPAKVYITGDSLGGIGSQATMLDYNAYNGPVDRVFTAALPYAAQIYRDPDPTGDPATVARMAQVPVWAVSGANDGTSPPEAYNRPLWRALSGGSSYPSASDAASARAGTSQFHYTEDPSLGHDVWSQNGGTQYRLLPDGAPMYDWLFSQTH